MDFTAILDNTPLIGVGFALLMVVIFLVLVMLLRNRVDPYPYQLQEALFTPAERNFLQALDRAVGNHLRVFGKVRVADVVKVKSMKDRGQWQRAFNKISGKHFDYVLCDPRDLSVVCAVELDDASHSQRKRIERDIFLEGVCAAAGLPLLRVPTSRHYDPREIQQQLREVLQQAA